ncbi:MAG: hypothetical protein JO254_11470, partial [Pseudolabrys sp.]|nr:hypothetical protein [Pseudolabrys sp.]
MTYFDRSLGARPWLTRAFYSTIALKFLVLASLLGAGLMISGALLSISSTAFAQTSSCQFLASSGATPAFCESLSGGASPGGRAGDLDDSKWSVGRFVQGGINATNNIAFPPTPAGPCKSGVTTVQPDNDIIVCDSASGHLGQFLTA